MATSAKRYGVDLYNSDIESRFRRIELELERRQTANFQTETQRRSRLNVPRVTGVRLDNSIIGALSVRWNTLGDNIDRYAVQVSPFKSFVQDVTTFKTNEPIHVFSELDADDTYYIRVRGVSTRKIAGVNAYGSWSAILNTTTGQGLFTNLQYGATGNITTITQTSGFNPTILDFTVSDEISAN